MEIKNGKIVEGSEIIGTAVGSFKFGYHPAVKVNVGKNEKWFEIDEVDILSKIIQYAKEIRKN